MKTSTELLVNVKRRGEEVLPPLEFYLYVVCVGSLLIHVLVLLKKYTVDKRKKLEFANNI